MATLPTSVDRLLYIKKTRAVSRPSCVWFVMFFMDLFIQSVDSISLPAHMFLLCALCSIVYNKTHRRWPDTGGDSFCLWWIQSQITWCQCTRQEKSHIQGTAALQKPGTKGKQVFRCSPVLCFMCWLNKPHGDSKYVHATSLHVSKRHRLRQ